MRPFRLGRWGSSNLPLGTRPPSLSQCLRPVDHSIQWRSVSTPALHNESSLDAARNRRGRPRKLATVHSRTLAASSITNAQPDVAVAEEEEDAAFDEEEVDKVADGPASKVKLISLPSPPPELATSSAKLAALHARLALPESLPLQTLARTLIHPTADRNSSFNNHSLAVLGSDLLGYYTSEHLLANFPRLPLMVLYAAQAAYSGRESLTNVAQSWGVEAAGAPGGEVDPGLLQFKRAAAGTPSDANTASTRPQTHNRRGDAVSWRRGASSRTVYDDQFGEAPSDPNAAAAPTTLDNASASFVAALFGALYLHAGAAATHTFFRAHVLSRQLDVGGLFSFPQPTRDLSRLCAREGFTSPVARLDAETGRASSSPVFVVGVYSGSHRLGQGAGSSLNEARWRAAAAALKGWYLYSPPEARAGKAILPSQTEGLAGQAKSKEWKPLHIDFGEIIA